MQAAMESIHGLVDVNTVVGDAIETPDGTVVIPVSRMCLGFAAGGGEYGQPRPGIDPAAGLPAASEGAASPFGGGSGAGVTVTPAGFLILGRRSVRFLPVDQAPNLERILDVMPELLERLQQAWRGEGKKAAPEDDFDDLDD